MWLKETDLIQTDLKFMDILNISNNLGNRKTLVSFSATLTLIEISIPYDVFCCYFCLIQCTKLSLYRYCINFKF